jgi:ribosomal protein S18 acetylase RimI-like enzyme
MQAGLVQSHDELSQIIELQRANLGASVSSDEAREQGFVTLVHTLDILKKMHAFAPSVVAKDGDRVVGYALTMTSECRPLLPMIDPLFVMIEQLKLPSFYVMGQVCVAKSHRGSGVFDALYSEHRAQYSKKFDCIVTEIATRNTRSMRAHERVGFEVVKQYEHANDEWAIVVWRWR